MFGEQRQRVKRKKIICFISFMFLFCAKKIRIYETTKDFCKYFFFLFPIPHPPYPIPLSPRYGGRVR
jgi:hypothetical protein